MKTLPSGADSPTPKQFRYAFTNTFSEEESQKAYDRYHVPGCRSVLLEGANANLNPRTALRVDFRKDNRAPLLFIGGGKDHIIPAWVNKKNAKKYLKPKAIVAYKEYPERCHFTAGEPGWEEVADYALDWAANPVATGPGRLTLAPRRERCAATGSRGAASARRSASPRRS